MHLSQQFHTKKKLGVLKGLIHRAYLFCDLKEDLLSELQLLRAVFISNGYARKLVDRTIKDSWKVELKKQVYASLNDEGVVAHEETEENPGYFKTFNAPYVPGFSEKIGKRSEKHKCWYDILQSSTALDANHALKYILGKLGNGFFHASINTSILSKIMTNKWYR